VPRVFEADRVRRGFVLRLPVERIVIAAMAEVEKTAGSRKKIECGFGVATCTLEDSAALAWPLLRFLQVKKEARTRRRDGNRAGRPDSL